MTPDAYGIWDTKTMTWWKRGNRSCWVSASGAGNAWNADTGARWRGTTRYSEQDRYVTRPLRFEPLDGPA